MSTITRGTSNVFADLGYRDAAERQVKTRLALAVNELLKARKLKQREIALLLGVPQPKVSALKNYRLDQFCHRITPLPIPPCVASVASSTS